MKILLKWWILTVFFAAYGIGPCIAFATDGKQNSQTVVVEDFRGKQLVFKKPVSRIVCILNSALTGLYMLGAQEKVVGVSSGAYTGSSVSYYAAMDKRIRERTLPAVSSSMAGSLERILVLKPEVVIVWSLGKDTISALEEQDIPVFGVFIDSVEDIYKEVMALGVMTGKSQRALELVNYTKARIQDIGQKIAASSKVQTPDAYFMWAKGELDSGGNPSIVQELLDMSGARNICGHIAQEHAVISMEYLLETNPDVIVMWYNTILDPSDISQKRAWKRLSAVANQNIYEIPDLFPFDLCTLNFQLALRLIAGWCHPEVFGKMSAAKEARDLFDTLYCGKIPNHLITERLSSAGSHK